MTIKSTGALKLSQISDEFEIEGQESDFPISLLAAEADLEAPHMWSEFYGLSSGPREFFTSFSITPSKHQHTVQWSLGRDDGESPEPSCKVFVYGQQGDSVTISDENILNPDNVGFDNDQTVFQFEGGYNRNWTLRLEIRNDRGSKFSEPKYFQSIPTLPSFDSALSTLRDPRSVGDEESQHLVGVIFDLTDEIPFEEGYEIEIFFKANDNQDFAQIDSTISRSTAMNANSPVTFSFAKGDDMANQAKTVILDGFRFELFTRYTVLLFIKWTGQVAEARGVIDFAGDRPDIPILGAVQGSNTIQLSWQHDNKSIKYELFYSLIEHDIENTGSKIYEVSGDNPVTTYTHQIGYNSTGWYLVKAHTKYSEAKSSPKQSSTTITRPELDGAISLLRDPNFVGYNGQEDVEILWDMKEGGPSYSEGYSIEVYWRRQTTSFLDSTLTHENADNSGSPYIITGRKGTGAQTALIGSMKFDRLSVYTILMKLRWTGQELAVPARVLLQEAGKVPDPARGFAVFASGAKALQVTWTDDEKATTYELYGSPSHYGDLSQGGTLLQTFSGGTPSYEYTHQLDYASTHYYQVVASNEYGTVKSGIKSASTSSPALSISGNAIRSGSDLKNISVNWTVLPTDLSGYNIEIQKDGNRLSGFNATDGSGEFTYAAPDWNKSYSIKCEVSWKDKNAYFNSTVNTYNPPPLAAPKNLNFSQVSGMLYRASWASGSSNQQDTSYQMRWKYWVQGQSESSVQWGSWLSNITTSYHQGTFSNYYYYKFEVRVQSGVIQGVTVSSPSSSGVSGIYKIGIPPAVSVTKQKDSTSNTIYLNLNFNTNGDKTGFTNYTGYRLLWKRSTDSQYPSTNQLKYSNVVNASPVPVEHIIGANQSIDYKLIAWWASETSQHMRTATFRGSTTDSWKFASGNTWNCFISTTVTGSIVCDVARVFPQNSSGTTISEKCVINMKGYTKTSGGVYQYKTTATGTVYTSGTGKAIMQPRDLTGLTSLPSTLQYKMEVEVLHPRDSNVKLTGTFILTATPSKLVMLNGSDLATFNSLGQNYGTLTTVGDMKYGSGSHGYSTALYYTKYDGNTYGRRWPAEIEIRSYSNKLVKITSVSAIVSSIEITGGAWQRAFHALTHHLSNGKLYINFKNGDGNANYYPRNNLYAFKLSGWVTGEDGNTYNLNQLQTQISNNWNHPRFPCSPEGYNPPWYKSGTSMGIRLKWPNQDYGLSHNSRITGKFAHFVYCYAYFNFGTLSNFVLPMPSHGHNQVSASTTWTINHPFNVHASMLQCKVVFSGSNSLSSAVTQHVSNSTVKISWSSARSGYAFLSVPFIQLNIPENANQTGFGGKFRITAARSHGTFHYSNSYLTPIKPQYFKHTTVSWSSSNTGMAAHQLIHGNYKNQI